MRFLPGDTISEFLYALLVVYLILSLVLTLYSVIRMRLVEKKTNDVKSGRNRVLELRKQGRYTQMPVYSIEEMGADKHKEDVRLFCFPNDAGKKSKFIIILPGGGYAHCCTKEEGYPVAAALNEMGYTAFILEYRTGLDCTPFGPMEDLGNALKLISNNQDKFNVTMDDYAIMGFSAGGNLASIFASHEHGYEEFGVPRPKTVILGYPWTAVNDWLSHTYWNIWFGLMGIWLSFRGNFYMFGFKHIKLGKGALDVKRYIDSDFPDTYMFSGSLDILVPASRHADTLEEAFKKNGVRYKYQKYFGLPHGIGLGKNTRAQGWLQEAVDFWEEI